MSHFLYNSSFNQNTAIVFMQMFWFKLTRATFQLFRFLLNVSLNSSLILDMVYLDENKATCRIVDQHPNPAQRKLSFVVSPETTTVKQFLEQVSTQFTYENFELILETKNVRQRSFNKPCRLLTESSFLVLDKPQRLFK